LSGIPDLTAPLPAELVGDTQTSDLAVPATAPVPEIPAAPSRRRRNKPRKARLRVAKFDPWSVMKTAFFFSVAFGVIIFVAVWASWNVLESSGLFEYLNSSVTSLITNPNDATPWRIQDYISSDQVLGAAALVAAVNVVLMTALGTLAAFLYNLAGNIIGGIEITLSDR
jgi:ABC-type phosphate transport system permease subunit